LPDCTLKIRRASEGQVGCVMIGENKPVITGLTVRGKRLEVLLCPVPKPRGTIVLIHEALGSVSAWKDFPEKLADFLGHNVLAYSRAGHGNSEGPVEPRSPRYYLDQVEHVLPALFHHFDVQAPVLYGHSEGAAIALLYAAQDPQVRAVIAECPIVAREERTIATVGQFAANYESSDLGRKLERHHRDPEKVFRSWIETIGDSPMMPNFPLQKYLERVQSPVLVLQGAEDEFGGTVQLQVLQKYLPHLQHEVFEGAGHLLHRERTGLVMERVHRFLAGALGGHQGKTVVSHFKEQ
jgi:pimeloyl-ACP methyl ester carboxylesterase